MFSRHLGAGRPLAPAAATATLLLAGCLSTEVDPRAEETFSTRNRVPLYEGLEPDAATVQVLDFGSQARILDSHRSFVRVETSEGLEGWLARSMLLDTRLQSQLEALTGASGQLPDQGGGRARDTLNVHLEPYRWSPTFYQLEKDEGFEVLDRMLVENLPASAATGRRPPEPTGLDYWYLVRLSQAEGNAGWLLANMAYPDLPLEAAMQAGGRPIVAHFPLGSVRDESLGESRTEWLWLQSTRGGQVHDFDLLRVIGWDGRLDRYRVFRQYSGLAGYLPIEVIPDMVTDHGIGTGFTLLLERDGSLRKRTHVYINRRLYYLGEKPVGETGLLSPPGGFQTRYRFEPR